MPIDSAAFHGIIMSRVKDTVVDKAKDVAIERFRNRGAKKLVDGHTYRAFLLGWAFRSRYAPYLTPDPGLLTLTIHANMST